MGMQYGSSNKYALVASQIFDGVGAAVHGTAAMIVTAIITEGSGRFGAASGLVNMAWLAGVGVGNVVFGYIADESYQLAFLLCGVLGVLPLSLLRPLQLRATIAARTVEASSDALKPVAVPAKLADPAPTI